MPNWLYKLTRDDDDDNNDDNDELMMKMMKMIMMMTMAIAMMMMVVVVGVHTDLKLEIYPRNNTAQHAQHNHTILSLIKRHIRAIFMLNFTELFQSSNMSSSHL